jgi:hypothetical protein
MATIRIITLAFLAAATTAYADEVRRSDLPDVFRGTWGLNDEACAGSGDATIVISARKYVSGNLSCAIDWVTVTASRDVPVYSVRSRCVNSRTGAETPPSFLLFRESAEGGVSIGSDLAKLTDHRRCR